MMNAPQPAVRRSPLWVFIVAYGALFTMVPAFILGALRLGAYATTAALPLFVIGGLTGWLVWKRRYK